MASTRRLSYDGIARDQVSLGGMLFDDFMTRVIDEYAGRPCRGPDCLHCAALALRGLKRIVEHPDDCPECAALNARDTV